MIRYSQFRKSVGLHLLKNRHVYLIKRTNTTVSSIFSDDLKQELVQELKYAKPFVEIPGPKPIPLLGNMHLFLPKIGKYGQMDRFEMQKRLHSEYGDIVRISKIPGRKDTVFVYDPESIRKVFRHEGPTPMRPSVKTLEYYRTVLRKDTLKNTYGLVTQGQDWLDFRNKVNVPLLQPRLSKKYVSHIDKVVNDFICRIHLLRDNDGFLPKNFKTEMHKWALESIASASLDTRLGCIAADLKPDSESQKIIDAVLMIFDGINKLDFQMSLWRYISTPVWIKYVEANDYITKVSLKYVDEAIERLKNRSGDQNSGISILETVLHRNVDKISASVMAIELILGGIHTVVSASASLLYHVAKNPEIQQKLYEEIRNSVPKYGYGMLTSSHLENLRYMKACIKESFRLSPTAFNLVRELPVDIVLSNYVVPKGTPVLICNGVLGKFEKYFYSPEEFIPERWLRDPTGKLEKKIDPFTHIPFGFGRRMCVGRRLAEQEIEILITRILQNFRVEYEGEMEFKIDSLRYPASPYNFKLIERDL